MKYLITLLFSLITINAAMAKCESGHYPYRMKYVKEGVAKSIKRSLDLNGYSEVKTLTNRLFKRHLEEYISKNKTYFEPLSEDLIKDLLHVYNRKGYCLYDIAVRAKKDSRRYYFTYFVKLPAYPDYNLYKIEKHIRKLVDVYPAELD